MTAFLVLVSIGFCLLCVVSSGQFTVLRQCGEQPYNCFIVFPLAFIFPTFELSLFRTLGCGYEDSRIAE